MQKKKTLSLSVKSVLLQFYDTITDDSFQQDVCNAVIELIHTVSFLIRLAIDAVIVLMLYMVALSLPLLSHNHNINSFIYQILPLAVIISILIIFKKIIFSYLY